MAAPGQALLAQTNTAPLLTAATATNSAPSGASAGVSLKNLDKGTGGLSTVGHLWVKSTAGSGTMTVTLKLWLYHATPAIWAPAGSSPLATYTDASKGLINLGNAIGETGTDVIQHCEPIYDFALAERMYLEITAIGGTSTAISAWLVV